SGGAGYLTEPGPHTPAGLLKATATSVATGAVGGAAGRRLTTVTRKLLDEIPAVPRLAQDIAVSPKVPEAMKPFGRSVGRNPVHNKEVADLVEILSKDELVMDIRVDQQQINAAGVRVGLNRPDLQYTKNGIRYYVEWDSVSSDRGLKHASRILANDPNARITLRQEIRE
ncbi:hypothetical protein, partial [Rathayibacter toxicus]